MVHDIPWDEDRNRRLRAIVHDLGGRGARRIWCRTARPMRCGAMGYVLAAQEIVGARPDVAWIVHASGSAGTQAGLLAGLLALGHPARVIGIDVDAQAARVAADVRRVGREAAGLLGVGRGGTMRASKWRAIGAAPGYGVPTRRRTKRSPSPPGWRLLLSIPVYAGKGMAGLIGLARQGRFGPDEAMVWIHTGGVPGIFAYPDTMARVSGDGRGPQPGRARPRVPLCRHVMRKPGKCATARSKSNH